jgi:hypothetical protein
LDLQLLLDLYRPEDLWRQLHLLLHYFLLHRLRLLRH